jgi:SPASM domain peptide maturase of grasp-with-spasm system
MGNVAYTMQTIKSPKDCDNNSSSHFNVSVQLYTEAQNHNSYFNRKIAIDTNGNIKNCSASENIHGNVKTDKIDSIIESSAFQKLWFVKKDEIEICKDCEFRYMCIDSRIPIKNQEGVWYHEKECNYNPYIAKWKSELGYITIKEFKQTEINIL